MWRRTPAAPGHAPLVALVVLAVLVLPLAAAGASLPTGITLALAWGASLLAMGVMVASSPLAGRDPGTGESLVEPDELAEFDDPDATRLA